jgi:hypothetical protein
MYGDMMYFYDNGLEIEQLLGSAIPYELGSELSGYFQYSGDIDLVKVEPEQDQIVEFGWNESDAVIPIIEVFKLDEEKGRLMHVTNSYMTIYYSQESTLKLGLEGGETYVFYVSNFTYQPSLENYKITSEVLMENPGDAYEANNTPKEAKPLPDYQFSGNFALTGDVDMYYFEAEKDEVLGLYVEVLNDPKHQDRNVSAELYQAIDPLVAIVEDVDGKGEISYTSPAYMFDRGWGNEEEYGSFKVKKGKGYFIILENWLAEPSLVPYRMTVSPAQQGEKTTGSIQDQAEPLSSEEANKWSASGYLKAGIDGGDVNYYSFTLDREANVEITFDVPLDIDGELTLYDKDGKVIEKSGIYAQGDSEVIIRSLDKGMYYIGVKDTEGNPSIRPYEVLVEVQ